MFGYVTADKPNMLIKDYATYRAYYCGLCKTIARKYPPFMRMTVNYDIAFLSLIAHNYARLEPVFDNERCIVHPVGKKFAVVRNDPIQERIVDINTILGYYKVYDDVADRGGIRHRIARAYLKGKYRRAARKYPELDEALRKCFGELAALEKADSDDIDALCLTSADMLIAVGKAACPDPDENLYTLCDNLGRWIYLIDAYDDMRKDKEKGAFNPLLPRDGELTEEVLDKIQNKVSEKLYGYIREIRAAYDRMSITVSEAPLSNVIYLGLRARTEEVLQSRGMKCRKTLL